MPKLEIKSSAVVQRPYQRLLLFGGPNKGKSMVGATAEDPLWVLTEQTRADSMTSEVIESAFPPPDDTAIEKWLKEVKGLKGKALEEAANALGYPELKEMTGVTYDMPKLEFFEATQLNDVLETLKACSFKTIIFDSASVLSKMLLDHYVKTGGKGGAPLADKRRAYGIAAEKVLEFFRELYKLDKHLVFITRGVEFQVNVGSKDDPVFMKYLKPGFEGQQLGRGIPHDISHIFQSVSRTGDSGKEEFFFRTRKQTADEWERTSCPHLADEEPAHLAKLFRKMSKK